MLGCKSGILLNGCSVGPLTLEEEKTHFWEPDLSGSKEKGEIDG